MATVHSRTRQPGAEHDLDIATVDAWREYLDTTGNAGVYEAVEPWAWARLQQRLRALHERRRTRERRTA